MHTCEFLTPLSVDHWEQCHEVAVGSVLISWYDEYAGYCETLVWYCAEHYGHPRSERSWQEDNMSFEY